MKSVSLKEVCDVFGDGDWIESKDQSDGGIRLIQTGNVGVGVFKDRIEKARWISEDTFKRLRCTEIREGDVLISRLPDPVGRSCLIPALEHKAITAVDCSILRFNPDKMNSKFFIYYSQSSQYVNAIEPLISGSTRQRISREKLGTIQIPLPSLKEQQVVVEKLDSAFAELNLLEDNLKLTGERINQLFESLLSSAFIPNQAGIKQNHSQLNDSNSWYEVSLKELCEVDWGNTKLTKSSYTTNGKFLAVSASGADGRIDYYEHEANVPVLSAIGAQCGKMFYPNEKFTAIKNTITLTPKKSMVDGKFLYYLFTHVELPQRGAGQPFISKGDIEAFRVDVPINLEEQQKIVKKLDDLLLKIEFLRSQYKKEIDQTSALRQSLLNSAFTLEEEVA
jgi:type I restriction enzyme S subunit